LLRHYRPRDEIAEDLCRMAVAGDRILDAAMKPASKATEGKDA
jgi:hypothetical protein